MKSIAQNNEIHFPPDSWSFSGDIITRHHSTPRQQLFTPNEAAIDCPVPIEYIDVQRCTRTDIDSDIESTINDVWYNDPTKDHRSLSDTWTGTTSFTIRREQPPEGQTWIEGRLTKIQSTSTRPDNVWPEMWTKMSKKQKKARSNRVMGDNSIRQSKSTRRARTDHVHPGNVASALQRMHNSSAQRKSNTPSPSNARHATR